MFIPVALRCDQLDAAPGTGLAAKAAAYLTGQGLLAGARRPGWPKDRSRGSGAAAGRGRRAHPRGRDPGPGPAACLGHEAGGHARCVVTSRVAGYTGPPVPGALRSAPALVPKRCRRGLGLAAAATCRRQAENPAPDPAVGAMARVPLLLALLCSLASHPGQDGRTCQRPRPVVRAGAALVPDRHPPEPRQPGHPPA